MNSVIVLIMIGLFANVWISWGIGKHFQLISVYAICASLGRDTSRAMRHHLLLSRRGKEIRFESFNRSPIVSLQMRSFILVITYITTWTRRTPTSSCLSVLRGCPRENHAKPCRRCYRLDHRIGLYSVSKYTWVHYF